MESLVEPALTADFSMHEDTAERNIRELNGDSGAVVVDEVSDSSLIIGASWHRHFLMSVAALYRKRGGMLDRSSVACRTEPYPAWLTV